MLPSSADAVAPGRCRQRFLHENWQFSLLPWQAPGAKIACSTLEWLPARVPGHLHLDLLEQGVIADPFERMNELGCQWLDEQDASYRTRFDFTPDPNAPRRVLRFEGLDTACSVYLNEQRIAEHRNMFVPLEIDVSGTLAAGENRLEVRFQSAVRVGKEVRAAYFDEHGLADNTERFDERSFLRKAQYMYGWDWGPRLVSLGIWRPLSLLEYSGRIRDVHVTQESDGEGGVRIQARTLADSGLIVHHFSGAATRIGDGQVAQLSDPERWYPRGMGAQPLYTLTTYLCPPDFDSASLAADPLRAQAQLAAVAWDQRTTKVGIRSLRLRQEPDAFGRSFEIEVNGEPVWILGANWIPDHSFPSRVSRQALRERLESACEVGMNMLRVWGGGLYESDDFYELCDEFGLLVWQDFPFACAYYPDTGRFCDELAEEARANVLRLRNHPSLALWCGNNECQQVWEHSWGGKDRQPPRYYGEHLYDDVLPRVLREFDPERPYIPTSPYGGEKDSNANGIGDQHYWDVWHGRGDWQHYRDSGARFSSEYGFASSCSMRAWNRVFATHADSARRDESVALSGLRAAHRDPIVRWHDKTAKGYEVFLAYVALHYPEPQSLEDWVYFSQLNQRDAIRTALEHYRRSEFCRGSLIWQLNDCWPVQSWALIDSEAQPKPAWFELRRLHAPRLLSVTVDSETAEVHAALDNSRSRWQSGVTLRALSLCDGTELRAASAEISLEPRQRKSVLCMSLAGLKSEGTLLVASAGNVTAQSLLAEPKALDLAPAETLTVSAENEGILRLRSRTPLIDLVVTDEEGTAGFRDNCVSLPRPGLLELRYRGTGRELRARSLAGRHPLQWLPARPI